MITRFAPSPTGRLHLGNLRTALFNALLAFQHQGAFLLRIEDTDRQRSHQSFSESILQDLEWLGLKWKNFQEKESVIFQSHRQKIYLQYYQSLIEEGRAYPCFCTESQLKQKRDHQKKHRQAPVYDKTCRNLSKDDVTLKKAQGIPYSLRFKIPLNRTIVFKDLIKGMQEFKSEFLSDFIIQRSDRTPSFLYCNALDDALMKITHVLRGEDHVSNTAKQLCLFEAMHFTAPQYGHLPLIVSQHGDTPLSKRDNSFTLQKLKHLGYFPLALLNYLIRVGHTVSERNFMNLEQLVDCFSIEKIHKSSAHFDEGQLNFWQKQAMQHQNSELLWNVVDQELRHSVTNALRDRFLDAIQPMVVFPSEIMMWAKILLTDALEYTKESKEILSTIQPEFWKGVMRMVQLENLNAITLKQYISDFDRTKVKLHWRALRLGLTEREKGPELVKIMDILGKERIFIRLRQAVSFATL